MTQSDGSSQANGDGSGGVSATVAETKAVEGSRSATPQELLAGLRWLALRMGRTPRTVDVNSRLPYTHTTYYNVFGSFTAAQEAAGLRPNKRGGQRDAPAPSEEFRDRWAWLAGYAKPREAIRAALERAEREDGAPA